MPGTCAYRLAKNGPAEESKKSKAIAQATPNPAVATGFSRILNTKSLYCPLDSSSPQNSCSGQNGRLLHVLMVSNHANMQAKMPKANAKGFKVE